MVWIEGLLTGLAMIIFIGPVLFTLLQASLRFGFQGGMAVAIGIIVSDVLAVGICLLGAKAFFTDVDNQFWIAIGGGVILLVLGLKYILDPKLYAPEDIRLGTRDFGNLFSKGFLVNFVNPFVFLVWIGLIGYAEERYDQQLYIYLAMVLLGIFITDSLKAYFAGKLRSLLVTERLALIYRIIGILMILFSLRLFYHAIVF
ncbi:MAG: LysE family transporter [Flavobacteriales bacterium]|nr:LysE family transporter [Flavobacteriales bacterium]